MHNQQMKGKAVNCLRFACGVWDDLFGWRRELPNDLPGDAGVHSAKKAWAALRELLSVYPEHQRVQGPIVEPADLIVVGPRQGGPSHALIVGARKNQLWEAVKPRVDATGITLDPRVSRVLRIYRIRNRERWLPNG